MTASLVDSSTAEVEILMTDGSGRRKRVSTTKNLRQESHLVVWAILTNFWRLGFLARDLRKSHVPMWLMTLSLSRGERERERERENFMFLCKVGEMGRAEIHQMKLGRRLQIWIFQAKDYEGQCRAKKRAKHGELLNTPPTFKNGKLKVRPWTLINVSTTLHTLVIHPFLHQRFEKKLHNLLQHFTTIPYPTGKLFSIAKTNNTL